MAILLNQTEKQSLFKNIVESRFNDLRIALEQLDYKYANNTQQFGQNEYIDFCKGKIDSCILKLIAQCIEDESI